MIGLGTFLLVPLGARCTSWGWQAHPVALMGPSLPSSLPSLFYICSGETPS